MPIKLFWLITITTIVWAINTIFFVFTIWSELAYVTWWGMMTLQRQLTFKKRDPLINLSISLTPIFPWECFWRQSNDDDVNNVWDLEGSKLIWSNTPLGSLYTRRSLLSRLHEQWRHSEQSRAAWHEKIFRHGRTIDHFKRKHDKP